MKRVLTWGLGLFLGASFLVCSGQVWPLEVLVQLGIGWAFFLREVLPQVHPRGLALAETAAVVAVLAVGLHLFLRWLWRQWHAGGPEASPWPPRWSVSLLALLVLLFGATMATVGIAHHVGWMVSSPEPLLHSSWRDMAARSKSRAEQLELCQRARLLLSEDKVPEARILQTLLREPERSARLEHLAVVPWKGEAGEVGFLVFERDPIVRAEADVVRCGGGLDKVEFVSASELPRLLEEAQAGGTAATGSPM